MRVIFSRKGFDSSAGGCPSPIVGSTPISLPIPTRMPSTDRYADLLGEVAALVSGLTKGRINGTDYCHLDPDIDASQKRRMRGWRGALGQVSAAASHLRNQCVAPGDLFLFWGLFQAVNRLTAWKFQGPKEHRIFGWLQVDAVRTIGLTPEPILDEFPWLKGHPHLESGWDATNTVYIARDHLRIDGVSQSCRGWGLFKSGHRLTSSDSDYPSHWDVPDWLNPTRGGVGMSYNPDSRWSKAGTLKAAARGQEFVAEITGRRDALDWLNGLFDDAP